MSQVNPDEYELKFIRGKTRNEIETKTLRWKNKFVKKYENHYTIEFSDYDNQQIGIIDTPVLYYRVILYRMVYKQ
jgi:hypothetical protein